MCDAWVHDSGEAQVPIEPLGIRSSDIDREHCEMGLGERGDRLDKSAAEPMTSGFGQNVETTNAAGSHKALVWLTIQTGDGDNAVPGETGKKRFAGSVESVCTGAEVGEEAADHVMTLGLAFPQELRPVVRFNRIDASWLHHLAHNAPHHLWTLRSRGHQVHADVIPQAIG